MLIPAMDPRDMSEEEWENLAEAIHYKQKEAKVGIKVLLVGDTVKEAYENSRDLIELYERHKVEFEIIYVPTDIAEELQGESLQIYKALEKKRFPGHRRLRWRHLARKADPGDWWIGSLMTSIAAGVNSYIWFYQAPIDPTLAWALTISSSAPTLAHTMKLKFLDRVYRFKLFGKRVGKRVHAVTEVTKRQMVNLFYAELFRFTSGPIGGASAALTLQGQAEILMHVAAYGMGSAIFSSSRNRYFAHAPEKSRWVNFYKFVTAAPFVVRDIGGQYLYSWDVLGFQVHDSTLMVLAANLTMAAGLKFRPIREVLSGLVDRQLNMFERLKNWVKRKKAPCDLLFGD